MTYSSDSSILLSCLHYAMDYCAADTWNTCPKLFSKFVSRFIEHKLETLGYRDGLLLVDTYDVL